ncbi:MAG: DUF5686 family protein [Bacteroidota bacterium]
MQKLVITIFFLAGIFNAALAIRLSGTVRNEKGEALPFTSLSVKNKNVTTAANNQGSYFLDLAPGKYVIIFRNVGYEKKEMDVIIGDTPLTLDVVLTEQRVSLKEVVIRSDAEDPAYEIIRNAIKKRKYYLEDMRAYECDVYSKGVMNLRDFPNKFMGQKVDFEDGDSSKKKMIYLSETVSKVSVEGKGKSKIEVVSTRVSGDKDGFGFAGARWISFYENNINLRSVLNPRGFVSPIADNALSIYRYKYMGTYFEDNQQIHSIRVIPKRKYEPAFSGIIQIVEDAWCIHSVNLILTKESQMSFADTLRVEQLYQQKGKDFWIIQNQVIYPAIKFFGFDAYGSFSNVYTNVNTEPAFSKKHFDNVFLKYVDGSNKKSFNYWDSIRPLTLADEERKDYIKKDSLEQLRSRPEYLDSLDKKRNKIKLTELLLSGKTLSYQAVKRSFTIPSAIQSVSFYPGEGVVFDMPFTFTQKINQRKRYEIIPHIRYGLSADQLYYWGTFRNFSGKKYLTEFSLSGGIRPLQFDPENPVDPLVNTFSALQNEDNFLKMYAANYVRSDISKGVGTGFIVFGGVEFQDRIPFDNTSDASWVRANDKMYSPNYPNEVLTEQFRRHDAFLFSLGFSYRHRSRYIEFPDRVINIGSRWPLFTAKYTKGVKGLLGSDVDFDKWQTSLEDTWNWKLKGALSWKIRTGGFINKKRVEIQDYYHFTGNRFSFSSDYMNAFQLPDFYLFSNNADMHYAVFAEHHFNGFITNKIPLLKKWNWYFVAGGRALWFDRASYTEWNFGLENIFKVLRVDMVYGALNGKMLPVEFRLGTRVQVARRGD